MAGQALLPAQNGAPEAAPDVDQLQLTAARLYAQGFKRPQIANILLTHLSKGSSARTRGDKLKMARRKLYGWEHRQEFRDLIYNHAIVGVDMELPGVLKGVTARAKRGRVDAAKLLLDVTGRHTDKSAGPATVIVQINAVPRPEPRAVIEAEAEEVE